MAATAGTSKTFSSAASMSYLGSRIPYSFLASPGFVRFNFPSRLRISLQATESANHVRRFPLVASLGDSRHDAPMETGADSKEAIIDIKLPRRSMSVRFTCNSCGERTQRMINRLAYERGTVFVQCAGCLKHHKLVDNLGLIVEYDFRENNDSSD